MNDPYRILAKTDTDIHLVNDNFEYTKNLLKVLFYAIIVGFIFGYLYNIKYKDMYDNLIDKNSANHKAICR